MTIGLNTRTAKAAIAALMLAAAPAAYAQNLLIRGGPIHTGVVAAPSAEVVLVRDGRIVFVDAREPNQGATRPGQVAVMDLLGEDGPRPIRGLRAVERLPARTSASTARHAAWPG